MRAIAITGAVMGMALMTGCSGVERLEGDASPAGARPAVSASASPAGSVPAVTPTRTTTPVSAPTATSRPPAPTRATSKPAATTGAPRVLGPLGFGALRRGMTHEEAEATRLIEGYEIENFGVNCGISKLKGTNATVFFTPGVGLSSISMSGGVRTPEGIKLGSSMSAVQAAYPDWEEVIGGGDTGYGWARTPGNSRAQYRIDVRDAKVTYVALAFEGQRCIE